jgi:DNA-binding MarR family transcriptional regulator
MQSIGEKGIGFWVNRVGAAFRAHLHARSRENGLAASEANVLHVLDQLGPSSLVDISRTLGHAHPSVLRQIDHLEDAGYVVRLPHPADRRMKLVCLTDEGRRRIPTVKKLIAGTHAMATRGFDDSSVDELLAMLRKIAVNLECGESVDECSTSYDRSLQESQHEEQKET